MDNSQPVPMLKTRLSVQMFLQFAIWGSWIPVLGNHLSDLKFDGAQIGAVYAVGPLASMLSPLLAGQIADRYLPTQVFLAICNFISGGLFLMAAQSTTFNAIWWEAFVAMLFFMPTLGLANSLCFTHMKEPSREFPLVRVWGTIGWIAGGWILSYWLKLMGRPISDCFNIAGVFSLVNGLYVLTLPHTPPKGSSGDKFAMGKVLATLKDPSFATFTFLAFSLMVFTTFYYNFGGLYFEKGVGIEQANVPRVLSIGQFAEIGAMFILPFVLKRFGFKVTIAMGILAFGLRFGIFALGTPKELVIAAQALHGICFTFALAAAMIYVDKIATPDVRGSMQSFLSFVAYGVAMFIGSYVGGYVNKTFTTDGVTHWDKVWMVPAVGIAVVLVVFLAGFREKSEAKLQAAKTQEPELAGAGKS